MTFEEAKDRTVQAGVFLQSFEGLERERDELVNWAELSQVMFEIGEAFRDHVNKEKS